jgi:hypothetical protein
MSTARHHAEWLSLVEVSGPFLSMPVLMQVFPQGLIAHDPEIHRNLRQAHEEWEDSLELRRPDRALHRAWVEFTLRTVLEFKDEEIATGQAVQQTWQTDVREHDEILRPDLVIKTPAGRTDAGKARLFVQIYPADQHLEKPVSGKSWKASPDTRMAELLRNTGVCLGLVTNGHRWMLVNVLPKETAGFASWYANLWLEEPITLRAFRSLLSMERFFGVAEKDTLEAMLAESALNQQEVTDQLGYQVRQAVEVLIQSLDQADQEYGRELLGDVQETELYEASLTVMMRLVILFCAEERGLLLLGDPLFDQHYAVSTLRAQLREAADLHGEEVLERSNDGWCRLLSTFRAVYGGVEHERMTLPAYGGNLFDPDRFPFLEGRKKGTTWRELLCDPLPVNNRTVLHLLEALQTLQVKVPGGGPAESRRLSFRALDIEQIGHVYEGLLDHTAKRATEPVLGLVGAKNREPEIALAELEKLNGATEEAKKKLIAFLNDETGKTEKALEKLLANELFPEEISKFQAACGNEEKLWKRVKPFAGLIRDDDFGHPVVIPKGSVYVTEGTDRRSSGTHYTPKSLTEPIVQYTLEPLVYIGPAEGKPKGEWRLHSPAELLELNICDMACGSGAFLVQACRYLAERLVESWEIAEKEHPGVPGITPEGTASTSKSGENLIPKDTDERMIFARRIIAQRCLYGVDKNPLAAEMAKLSLWLLTLQKDKPFTFLDHAIRSGDSLVGIANTHQLNSFSLDGNGPDMPMFTDAIKTALEEVRLLRRQISELPDNSAEDVQGKALMLHNAEEQTKRLAYAANCLLVACWESTSETDREERLKQALLLVESKFNDLPVEQLEAEGSERLQKTGCPMPFHWPLEFPEVFMERGGFDGLVGNPPFLGGTRIRSAIGLPYLQYIGTVWGGGNRADLCTYFFLRGMEIAEPSGHLGLVATNSIAQGDSREFGLDRLVRQGSTIHRAVSSREWPGTAALEVSHVWIRKDMWHGRCMLDEVEVKGISTYLSVHEGVEGSPQRLARNGDRSFNGVKVYGQGFLLSPDEAARLLDADPRNKDVILPYLIGDDLNSRPDQSPSRWAINFFDWPLDQTSAPREYSGPVAADFAECLAIVESKVKPERTRLNDKGDFVLRKPLPQRWWIYGDKRPALSSRLSQLRRAIAIGETTKYCAFSFCPASIIFSHMTKVITTEDAAHFAVLSSSHHEAWARAYSSTLETRLKYNTTDAYETFPFPETDFGLDKIGEQYVGCRTQIMLRRSIGLTDTYNYFHDPNETAQDIQGLRDLHANNDKAVATAYGWTDFDLGHSFHETKLGLRFTISEAARREVLARLLKLNHERYAEEVAQGLHDKKKGGGKSRITKNAQEGPALF